jgi:hypothetical protein
LEEELHVSLPSMDVGRIPALGAGIFFLEMGYSRPLHQLMHTAALLKIAAKVLVYKYHHQYHQQHINKRLVIS